MTTHTIIVGNIGTACTTTDNDLAAQEFGNWIRASKTSNGRAAGESVTWMRDGEPYKGYEPPHPLDTLPDHELTAEQLDEKYNGDGDGEHPKHTVLNWIAAAQLDTVRDGYWHWVQHKLITEHENAPENQATVHNFTLAVTAPAELSREEVLELLTLFSSAATQQLEDTQDDDGADKDERERAAKALKMYVEVL